jgi:hypothetical protein
MRFANCSLEFLRRISRRRRSAPNGVESISAYVEHRAALLTPEHLEELRADLPLLNARFAAIALQQFPHLQQQLKLLADFFEDTADGVVQAGSDASRKETAFALRYTAKEKDSTKITTLGLSLSRHTKARRLQWQCWCKVRRLAVRFRHQSPRR